MNPRDIKGKSFWFHDDKNPLASVFVEPEKVRQINIGESGAFVFGGNFIVSATVKGRVKISEEIAAENPAFMAGESAYQVVTATVMGSHEWILPEHKVYETYDEANKAWRAAGRPAGVVPHESVNPLTYN